MALYIQRGERETGPYEIRQVNAMLEHGLLSGSDLGRWVESKIAMPLASIEGIVVPAEATPTLPHSDANIPDTALFEEQPPEPYMDWETYPTGLSKAALAAFICGILGGVTRILAVASLLSLANAQLVGLALAGIAIGLGHLALAEIRRSYGHLRGRQLARLALCLGYASFLTSLGPLVAPSVVAGWKQIFG